VIAPTHQSYRALLLQPSGPIYADSKRIGHWADGDGLSRCRSFLSLAAERGNQLVVVPEYCLPIELLLECVKGDRFPQEHAVWVLGCESLTPAALELFKQQAGGHCEVVHEPLQIPAVQGTYYDALAYCFISRDADGNPRRVVLFQFKTGPSRDPHFLENEHLKVGKVIYQFRNTDSNFGFSAIICSDAFTLSQDRDLCKTLTDRSVLVHIQLNPNPRHVDYRQYRAEIFQRNPMFSDCDIICLNWAQNVSQYDTDGGPFPWENIGGSAWYLPNNRCSTQDAEVLRNDSLGIYYTCLDARRHVLLFHYDEAAFELTVPKIANLGAAVQGNPLGPLANTRFIWDGDNGSWIPDANTPDAGLNELLEHDPVVSAAFGALKGGNRLSIERAIALSCGLSRISDSWHTVGKLEACQMKADEVVYRTTFCMDSNVDARTFRHMRVQRVASLSHILATVELPMQVRDISGGGATIIWNSGDPHVNVAKPNCLPAFISFLDTEPLKDRVNGLATGFLELLRRENKPHQKRVAVCYRKADGCIAFADTPALTRIDHDGGSLASITSVL
jgi:hypothetical protein